MRVEHLPRPAGSRILLSLYFSGFQIFRDNKGTSARICDGILFRVGPCDNVRHPGGGTLNVEVTGMLVGNFFGKP